MNKRSDINTLLDRISSFYEKLNDDLNRFLYNNNIISLTNNYSENNNQNTELGFNVFKIVSDTYYKENFHSDVLHELLNPESKHEEGQKFLEIFIDRLSGLDIKISGEDYQSSKVVREQGRIDILIYDKNSKHCIIIENKINNAVDMVRQIPRYVEYCLESVLVIDSIIYLPLDGTKTPNKSDWTEEDLKTIEPLLIIIPAYNDDQKDLVNLFLKKIQDNTDNPDVKVLVKHYIKLIKHLRKKVMNKPIFDDFLKEMKDGNNYKTAISISEMLNDFPNYLAEKMKDEFEQKIITPFHRIWIYNNNVTVFDDYKIDASHIAIDIRWERDSVKLSLFNRKVTDSNNPINVKLKEVAEIYSLQYKDDRWRKTYKLMNDFDKLYNETERIISSLK